MSTRAQQEERKNPPRLPPRKVEPAQTREARERANADPFDDDNPEICRGTD